MQDNDAFLIVDFDGINIGVRHAFTQTFLEMDSFEDAQAVANIWNAWIYEGLWV